MNKNDHRSFVCNSPVKFPGQVSRKQCWDGVWDTRYLLGILGINIYERKGEEAVLSRSQTLMQVQGSPSQLGRELWSKYCASELSHMGWKWPILYILVLFSHRMQAALGRRKAAQADPEEAVSCRFLLTTLPAAGQQILQWSGVWVVNLCICHKLKLATTQMSIIWRKVKFCCVHTTYP